jgi:hypothetical protein
VCHTADRATNDVDDDDRAKGVTVASAISLLHVLAAEGPKNSNIWNPTIIGILTVLSAIGLFCGSVYLLLATNLGARLGFLVAAAGLSGFMLLLATLWWTSGSSGIDPPHGRSPQWKVVEIVKAPAESKIPEIREIAKNGKLIPPEALTNLKPAVDAAVVPDKSLNGETPKEKPFATLGFSDSSEYLAEAPNLKSYEEGGGTKNIFWHNTKYAVVQLCVVQKNVVPPTCDPLKDTPYIVLKHDLGTLRQPVVAYWFMSLLLFGLTLLGLHWYEQDQRARTRAGLAPVPSPGS